MENSDGQPQSFFKRHGKLFAWLGGGAAIVGGTAGTVEATSQPSQPAPVHASAPKGTTANPGQGLQGQNGAGQEGDPGSGESTTSGTESGGGNSANQGGGEEQGGNGGTQPETTVTAPETGSELATNKDVTNAIVAIGGSISADLAKTPIPGCTDDGNGNINCYFPLNPNANDPNNGWTLQITNSTTNNARTIDLYGPPFPQTDPNATQADRQTLFVTDGYQGSAALANLHTPNQTTDSLDTPDFNASVKDGDLTIAELNTLTSYFAPASQGGNDAFNSLKQNPKGFDLSELNVNLHPQVQKTEAPPTTG